MTCRPILTGPCVPSASPIGRVHSVPNLGDTLGLPGAVGAAVEATADLDAVADNPAAAPLADRGHLLDGALKAVEDVPVPGRHHLEGLVVVIAAHLADRHPDHLPTTSRLRCTAPGASVNGHQTGRARETRSSLLSMRRHNDPRKHLDHLRSWA